MNCDHPGCLVDHSLHVPFGDAYLPTYYEDIERLRVQLLKLVDEVGKAKTDTALALREALDRVAALEAKPEFIPNRPVWSSGAGECLCHDVPRRKEKKP